MAEKGCLKDGIFNNLEVTELLAFNGSKLEIGDDLTLTSSTTQKPVLTLKNTTNDANGSILKFVKDKGAAGAANDVNGLIQFFGDDANQDQVMFSELKSQVKVHTNGQEGGKLTFSVAEHDGTSTAGLTIEDGDADGELDVTIGAGAASLTTITGNLDVTGDTSVTTLDSTGATSLATAGGAVNLASSGVMTTVKGTLNVDEAVTFDSTLTVGVDDTGHDVKFFGATSGQYMLWDESADELVLAGDSKLSFFDANGGENILASSDGHLEINSGTILDITAPTVEMNSSTTVTINGPALTLSSATSEKPVLTIENTNTDAEGSIIKFLKNSGTSAADGDKVGTISWDADSEDAGLQTNLANIIVSQEDATAASDNASMVLEIMTANSVKEVARLNPESFTADTFCGGFGFRYPIFTGAAGDLTAGMSGAIITVSTVAGYTIDLPVPSLGLHYKFVIVNSTAGGDVVIRAISSGDSAENLFTGILNNHGTLTQKINVSTITFVSGTVLEGNFVEVYCISESTADGSPTWFVKGECTANNGITIT